MAWYRKYYRCICGHEWQDEWDCLCDDRCPVCNTSMEILDFAEIDEGKPKEEDSTNESDREHFPTSGEGGNNSDQRTCADHTASSSGGSEVPASSLPLDQGVSEG